MKSASYSCVVLGVILVIMVVSWVEAEAQNTCSSSLSSLNVCAPFVVPGAVGSPSPDCCGALQSINHDCLCSTLRIASRIPAHCNLPPLSCRMHILLVCDLHSLNIKPCIGA